MRRGEKLKKATRTRRLLYIYDDAPRRTHHTPHTTPPATQASKRDKQDSPVRLFASVMSSFTPITVGYWSIRGLGAPLVIALFPPYTAVCQHIRTNHSYFLHLLRSA